MKTDFFALLRTAAMTATILMVYGKHDEAMYANRRGEAS